MMHLSANALAGTVGLVMFIVMFAIAVTYALWPSNKETFDRLARLPLEEDDGDKK
jgi:cytochrome c oxidase cbb3-type subunit 4